VIKLFQVLTALDALDRHSFDRMDATNSLDTLYAKIFSPPGTKESGVVGGTTCNTNNSSTNSTASNNGTNGGDTSRDSRADYVCILFLCLAVHNFYGFCGRVH
jgi:hypothetical protein